MKIGDLVAGKKSMAFEGSIGIIFGFDGDGDPIISWCNDVGSHEQSPGCGEFKTQVKVISESR